MRIIIIIICLSILSHQAVSQMCGTIYQDIGKNEIYTRLTEGFIDYRTYNGDVPIVRLSLNQVNRTNGTGGLSWMEINTIVDGLSDLYDNRICFTVIERNEINNDLLFGVGNGGALYEQLITTNNIQNAVRIYFVENGNSGGVATGPILNPIFDPNPFTIEPTVYLSNGFTGFGGVFVSTFTTEVLAHEIGHVFGLWHTFTTFNGSENVARTGVNRNCDTSGDLLCDTPADPGLEFLLNNTTGDAGSCIYFGTLPDPVGEQYNPSTSNIMSYTHPGCMSNLSTDQIQRAINFMTQTNLLDDIIIPNIITLNGSENEDVFYHADDEIISETFHTDGIVNYTAQSKITLMPGFKTSSSTTSEFLATIDELCHDEGENNSGLVGYRYSKPPLNNIINVYPNPSNGNVAVTGEGKYFSRIELLTSSGRLIKVFTDVKGLSYFKVELNDLKAGMYFVKVVFEDSTVGMEKVIKL